MAAQSLYYMSAILLQWTQPFYFFELNHFAVMNSAIFATLLSHFVILLQWTHSFCDLVSHFVTLNLAILLQCPVISWFCYSKLSHFTNLSSFLLQFSAIFWLLRCSAIPRCYSAQSFFNCYGAQPFSGCSVKAGARAGGGPWPSCWRMRDRAVWVRCARLCRIEPRGRGARRRARGGTMARLVWLIGRSRWWITAPYIYIHIRCDYSQHMLSENRSWVDPLREKKSRKKENHIRSNFLDLVH
jgi:hypothetical protein